jgi:DNA modification methylase
MSVRIIHGDCRDVLATLPADSFDCCVTSPPYWGLRDYGVEGQIGIEPTMRDYLETMVGVCREIKRVLKPQGTFWLNIGDCYNAGRNGGHPGGKAQWCPEQGKYQVRSGANVEDLKPKDLCMIPNRLAIMLQDDGWYVRSEIIWHKPNPMPESVRDRPTCAHEKVWLLTKIARYFYDADAIAERSDPFSVAHGKKYSEVASKNPKGNPNRNDNGGRGKHCGVAPGRETRNARNVWSIASQPYSGAHFATMPPALAERCIKAGCPQGGSVIDPFGGAGTTGIVADRLGRNVTLIELNPEYRSLAESRVTGDAPLLTEVTA